MGNGEQNKTVTPRRSPAMPGRFTGGRRQPRLHNETASRIMKSHFVADVELTSLAHHESSARNGFSAGSFTLGLAATSFFAWKGSAYGPGLPIGLASLVVSLLFFGWGVRASLYRRSVLDEIRGITRPERSPFTFRTRSTVRTAEESSRASKSKRSQQTGAPSQP